LLDRAQRRLGQALGAEILQPRGFEGLGRGGSIEGGRGFGEQRIEVCDVHRHRGRDDSKSFGVRELAPALDGGACPAAGSTTKRRQAAALQMAILAAVNDLTPRNFAADLRANARPFAVLCYVAVALTLSEYVFLSSHFAEF